MLNRNIEQDGHGTIVHNRAWIDHVDAVHLRQRNTVGQMAFENFSKKRFVSKQTYGS